MKFSKKLIVWLFGSKKRYPDFDFRQVDSILIRPVGDAVGDAVAHTAYARQLRSIYPNVKIGMFVSGRNRDIVAISQMVDEMIPDTFAGCLKNRKKWQLFLDFENTYFSRTIVLNKILAPHITIIFDKTAKSYYSADNILNYDFICPTPEDSHIVDALQTSKIAETSALPPAFFHLPVSGELLQTGERLWCSQSRKLRILLAPQGSAPERSIAPLELADLLNRCHPDLLARSRFLLCNTKNSDEYFAELRRYCPDCMDISLAARTTLYEYVALTAAADVVVCIDSGTVHLACALNRPVLSFYANHPANIHLWHPRPNEGVPNLMLIADQPSGTKTTRRFPMARAAEWLNGF